MLDLAIDSRVFIYNEVDEALQELDMIFNTENTELICYPEYGTNFEQFLWQLTPSPESLEKYIREKIASSYYLNKMDTNISVNVLKGDYRAIYHVRISVSNGVNTGEREYQFR